MMLAAALYRVNLCSSAALKGYGEKLNFPNGGGRICT
jgi:hypothetical protein